MMSLTKALVAGSGMPVGQESRGGERTMLTGRQEWSKKVRRRWRAREKMVRCSWRRWGLR